MNTDLSSFISSGVDRAKAGEALQVYSQLSQMSASEIPPLSHYGFGWILYYAMLRSPGHHILERKKMLRQYLDLRLQRPHKLHSMVLTQAIRLYKDAKAAAFGKRQEERVGFSIVRFSSLWGLGYLRPGDWKRKEYEGKPLSSTVEKLLTVLADEIGSGVAALPEEAFFNQIKALAEDGLRQYPDSYNVHMQLAVIRLAEGEKGSARELLRRAALLAPGKGYIWQRLSEAVPEAEKRLRLVLLHRAAKAPGPEQFKGRTRLALARLWLDAGMEAQALWELSKVKVTYEANGWHLPGAYKDLASKIPPQTSPSDPEPVYRRLDVLADEEVYGAIEPVEVTKTYHKAPVAAGQNPSSNPHFRSRPTPASWRVTDSRGQNFWIQPHRFGLHPDLPLGTRLHLRLVGSRPVHAALIPADA